VHSRDYQDALGGVLLIIAGAFAAFHALTTLSVGSLSQMGPGMFPGALGFILMVFGVVMAVPALFRPGPMPQFRIWTPLFVFGGIAAFALLVRPLGTIPAIFALTMIASFAELRIQPVSLILLSTALCLIAWIVFHVGLNIAAPPFRWPL
jgi:hypothetical protein